MSEGSFSPLLAKLLAPFVQSRSAFGPIIEKRVVVISNRPAKEETKTSSLSSELLHKIGHAYNGYRHNVMELVASAQDLLTSSALPRDVAELSKVASVPVEEMFTPLSFYYLRDAFRDEVGAAAKTAQARAGVERGLPLRNTRMNTSIGGFTS